MKIAVVGTGYVGLVSGACFAEKGNHVTCCDIDPCKIERLNRSVVPFYEPGLGELIASNAAAGRLRFTTDIAGSIRDAEVVYMTVGTPMSDTGEADLNAVKAVARSIGENLNGYKVVVAKSTVPVGTGRLIGELIEAYRPDPRIPFDMVSNPEFLREGSAVEDCMNMERAVIGADSGTAAGIVKRLLEPFHTTIFLTDIESAEMIKYAANAFLATKISFINEIANLCERVGADVSAVAEGIGMDSRIGPKFLQAGIGYGGSCLPKDTEALRHLAAASGYDFRLIRSVIDTNRSQRMIVIDKLLDAIGSAAGKRLAVLGLAFKPDTDDVRYAPSLDIIPALIQLGAEVRAYDPVAREAAARMLPACVEYGGSVLETLEDCDACLILTEWDDIRSMNLEKVKEKLKTPVLIDGRNCFPVTLMESLGFDYYSIGRAPVRAYTEGIRSRGENGTTERVV